MNHEEIKSEFLEEGSEKDEQISALSERIKELENQHNKLTQENTELREKLESESIHDHLTGLKNRKYFEENLRGMIASLNNPESKKRKEWYEHLSVLFIDTDHFKNVNDNKGHIEGDNILKKVSKIMKDCVRGSDIVSRWGGDEFGVILPGANEDEAFDIAEKMRKAVEDNKETLEITLSIGVACYEQGLDMDELTIRADSAMYIAKGSGKNRVVKYSEVAE